MLCCAVLQRRARARRYEHWLCSWHDALADSAPAACNNLPVNECKPLFIPQRCSLHASRLAVINNTVQDMPCGGGQRGAGGPEHLAAHVEPHWRVRGLQEREEVAAEAAATAAAAEWRRQATAVLQL
jgi:hypothetical protein